MVLCGSTSSWGKEKENGIVDRDCTVNDLKLLDGL